MRVFKKDVDKLWRCCYIYFVCQNKWCVKFFYLFTYKWWCSWNMRIVEVLKIVVKNVDIVLKWLNGWNYSKCENFVVLWMNWNKSIYIHLKKLFWKEKWEYWSQWKYCVEVLKVEEILHCIINHCIGISIHLIMMSFEIWFENFALRKECWKTSFHEMILG